MKNLSDLEKGRFFIYQVKKTIQHSEVYKFSCQYSGFRSNKKRLKIILAVAFLPIDVPPLGKALHETCYNLLRKYG
jgi:hypothetical protein